MEATKYEHVFSSSLLARIHAFEQWLSKVEESTIVIIGHAQYFKHMLKHSSNIHNCDVWKTHCTFTHHCSDGDSSASAAHDLSTSCNNGRSMHHERVTVKWDVPELQFRSPYSYAHPMNRFSFMYTDSSSDTPAVSVSSESLESSSSRCSNDQKADDKQDDASDNDCDEVTCRICQMTAQESSPNDVFIRPCKCSGTLSHVHISCLNEWRATSSTAAFKCYVCGYTYRIERTTLSRFLMSENGTHVISVILIASATLCMGVGGIYLANQLFRVDVCWEICQLAQWHTWWRDCSFYRLPSRVEIFFSFWTELLFQQHIDTIRAMFLCHATTVLVIEVLLVGCALLGVIGMGLFVLNEGYDIYQAFGHGQQDWQYLVGIGFWAVSLGSTGAGRLSIWLGFAMACRAAYFKIRTVGKKVAQIIGENILEPNA